jgi:hypothetical protein
MAACSGGHLDTVKYLCEIGGKELVMAANKVRKQERRPDASVSRAVLGPYVLIDTHPRSIIYHSCIVMQQ